MLPELVADEPVEDEPVAKVPAVEPVEVVPAVLPLEPLSPPFTLFSIELAWSIKAPAFIPSSLDIPSCSFFSRSLLSLDADFFRLSRVAVPLSGAINKPAITLALAPAKTAHITILQLSLLVYSIY